ncbi:amidase [Pseudactinotalea sp. HY158]|nr:amidase [Pseudactinotalea sp. HY158]
MDLTGRRLAEAIRVGEASAVEATEAALERIERRDGALAAFVRVTPELALAQARAADRLLAAAGDGPVPPLLGVPVPIKDLNMVAGLPMAAGSAALADFVAPVDDGVVTLLREAGTVMVGKTATPELGLPPYTETDIAPPVRNPWDETRSPGGSSGGAAAAVAGGMVPIAQGSDGGGSIRIPAAACGLVGLKPSRGRISTGPNGVDGAALATSGVLTRDVRDTALALDVLARPWPGDDRLLPRPAAGSFLAACDTDPGPLRVGVVLTPFITPDAPVHPEAIRAVEKTIALLEARGHRVEQVGVPFPAEQWQPFKDVWSVMAAQAPIPPEREHLLVPLTRWMRERGRGVGGVAYANAIANGQQLQRQAASAWADVDLVLSPTLAQPAAPIGSIRNDADPARDFEDQCAYTPWTSTWNILGAPAISLPVHRARVGGGEAGPAEPAEPVERAGPVEPAEPAEPAGPMLPFGAMLGARTGREDLLLALAASLEPDFAPGS